MDRRRQGQSVLFPTMILIFAVIFSVLGVMAVDDPGERPEGNIEGAQNTNTPAEQPTQVRVTSPPPTQRPPSSPQPAPSTPVPTATEDRDNRIITLEPVDDITQTALPPSPEMTATLTFTPMPTNTPTNTPTPTNTYTPTVIPSPTYDPQDVPDLPEPTVTPTGYQADNPIKVSEFSIQRRPINRVNYVEFIKGYNTDSYADNDIGSDAKLYGEVLFDTVEFHLVWVGAEWRPASGSEDAPMYTTLQGATTYCEWLSTQMIGDQVQGRVVWGIPTLEEWETAILTTPDDFEIAANTREWVSSPEGAKWVSWDEENRQIVIEAPTRVGKVTFRCRYRDPSK